MDSYKEKYLKYKSKYLAMKKYGGENHDNKKHDDGKHHHDTRNNKYVASWNLSWAI